MNEPDGFYPDDAMADTEFGEDFGVDADVFSFIEKATYQLYVLDIVKNQDLGSAKRFPGRHFERKRPSIQCNPVL